MQDKRTRIAIIGGGLGGLTFAISLAKFLPDFASHFAVDIYESTASLEAQVGAGLGIWPYTWSIVEALGLGEAMIKYASTPITTHIQPFFTIRKSNQAEGRDLFTLYSRGGGFVSFHRGHFQTVLLQNLPSGVSIHTRKRLRSYSQNQDGVLIEFGDDSVAHCDFLVGADGLQSNVRRTMLKEIAQNGGLALHLPKGISQEAYLERLSNPYWTGSIAYRYLIPVQKLKDAGWADHRVLSGDLVDVGKYGSVMSYVVANGTMVNFVGLRVWPELEGTTYNDKMIPSMLENKITLDDIATEESKGKADSATQNVVDENRIDPWGGNGGPIKRGRSRWVCPVDKSEVKDAFKGWETDIQALIDLVDEPLRWATHSIYPLPKYRSNMVCLIGDSAHAMLPYVGQGAAQALADAFTLGKLIACAVEDNKRDLKAQLNIALEAYDSVRRPISCRATEMSRDNMFRWSLFSPIGNGEFSEIKTDNENDLESMRQHMDYNWSLGWERDGPAREAERAISIFKRMSNVHSLPAQPRL